MQGDKPRRRTTVTSGSRRSTGTGRDAGTRVHGGKPIPLQYVIVNLDERVAVSDLYSDMVPYWPFLAMFFAFFLAGRDIEQNHMAAAGTRIAMMQQSFASSEYNAQILQNLPPDAEVDIDHDRVYNAINSAENWHAWFRDVAITNTWDCKLPDYSRATLVRRGQMQFIGAMKVRVMLMTNDSCTWNRYLVDNRTSRSNLRCHGAHDNSREQTRPRCNKPNPAKPLERLWKYIPHGAVAGGIYTTGARGIYHAGGYVAQLPFNSTCNMVREFAQLISTPDGGECGIIDDVQTRFVIAEWFQYSSNSDTFLFAKLFAEVSASGAWIPGYQVRMFPVWTTKRLGQSIFDIFFFLFVLYYLFRLIKDWVVFYRRHKKAGVLAYVFNVWNLMELTNISTFMAVLILRWMWWSDSQRSNFSFPFPPVYPTDLDNLALLFSAQIYANSFNVVITMLKVLKYLRLNSRFNVLTRTLALAQEAIAGVLLLFVFVVLGYAVCGTALYGGNVREFRNMNTSFSSLMFMLLGRFDYAGMRAQNPTLTGLYFFSYVVLAFFLLLNFIIAILSDGFAQVNQSSALEPLDSVVLRMLESIRNWLNPRNLKKVAELRLKGRSRTDLIAEMSKYLKEHVELIEAERPELLDQDYPMYIGDLRNWLPEQLHSDLGDYYLELLWVDMEFDHQIHTKSEDYQMKAQVEAVVGEGVALAMRNKLDGIDELEAQMDQIADHVANINEITSH